MHEFCHGLRPVGVDVEPGAMDRHPAVPADLRGLVTRTVGA